MLKSVSEMNRTDMNAIDLLCIGGISGKHLNAASGGEERQQLTLGIIKLIDGA